MGMIGKWIDEKCAEQPEVMRRVLGMRFGNLGNYVEGNCAGCLVGSYYIARGEWWAADSLTDIYDPSHPLFADAELGVQVAAICYRRAGSGPERRPQGEIVRAIKQRIRTSLGIAPQPRETLEVVGSRPPRNPQ